MLLQCLQKCKANCNAHCEYLIILADLKMGKKVSPVHHLMNTVKDHFMVDFFHRIVLHPADKWYKLRCMRCFQRTMPCNHYCWLLLQGHSFGKVGEA